MKKYFPWIIAVICFAVIPTIFVLASYCQYKKPVTVDELINSQATVTYKFTATQDGIVKQKTEFQFFKNFIYVDGAQQKGCWSGSTFLSEVGKFEFENYQVNVTWWDGTEWVYYNK